MPRENAPPRNWAAELKQRCAENRAAREVKQAAVKIELPVVMCSNCGEPGASFEEHATGKVRCVKCERRRYADAADAA